MLRVSGPHAVDVASAVVGDLPPARRAALRDFRTADGVVLDRGLVLFFEPPGSFTGEPVVELHAHGGPALLSMLSEALLAAGARHARPGEFSERAFLNARMDLAQAEAVADLIDASSAAAVRAAQRTLAGSFSKEIQSLAAAVDDLRVWTEAAIDFAEEEIDFLADPQLSERLARIRSTLGELLERTHNGVLLRDGVELVLAGRPNVGKSTLLNALAGRETAIVTDIPGTTRDPVRERVLVDGVVFNLVDTAGLRNSSDAIERIGIERTRQAMASAQVLLLVMEDEDAWQPEDRELLAAAQATVVAVRNKIDRSGRTAGVRRYEGIDEVSLCARSGDGLQQLRIAMLRAVQGEHVSETGIFSARQRHLEALRQTAAALERGDAVLNSQRAGELLAEELRLARRALGDIVGEQSSDELLGRIFSSFCIGK